MTHEKCKLEPVQKQDDVWGFVVSSQRNKTLVVLTYKTEARAMAAHISMATVIVGAAITPHGF